jgi:hypothetical protein
VCFITSTPAATSATRVRISAERSLAFPFGGFDDEHALAVHDAVLQIAVALADRCGTFANRGAELLLILSSVIGCAVFPGAKKGGAFPRPRRDFVIGDAPQLARANRFNSGVTFRPYFASNAWKAQPGLNPRRCATRM